MFYEDDIGYSLNFKFPNSTVKIKITHFLKLIDSEWSEECIYNMIRDYFLFFLDLCPRFWVEGVLGFSTS